MKIGDHLPDISVYIDGDAVKLSSFYEGKVLILDFWATWCAPCIKALPKLAALKSEFPDKLSVLPLTYERRNTVETFFTKHEDLRRLDLPYLFHDSVLHALFPHRTIPHEVWVNSAGVVIAITGSDDITKENIKAAILNDKVDLHVKRDVMNFNAQEPFKTGDSDFIFRSVLTGYRPGLPGGGSADIKYNGLPMLSHLSGDYKIRRIFRFNNLLSGLFLWAAFEGKVAYANRNRIVFEVKDSADWVPPNIYKGSPYKTMDEFSLKGKGTYCYELSLPGYVSPEEFYSRMLNDLNKALDVTGRIESREMDCYVLVNKREVSRHLKSHTAQKDILAKFGVVNGFRKMTIQEIVDFINFDNFYDPILNETVNSEPVDIDINYNIDSQHGVLNIKRLQEGFARLGFELIKARRKVEVVVIRDK
ncbi:redoxin domain-containing protein [Compostibacter hankyongensis]|uniref:Redoxin domain-containing protein n=1 Tax=Compostibacter hankyongensis TaxID=1007089 RepID=A0ABP8G4L4_9BACT